MLDIGFVRANLDEVRERLATRGVDPKVLDAFGLLDKARRDAITEVEGLKARRNRLSEEIGKLRRAGADTTSITEEVRVLKEESESKERAAAEWDQALQQLMQAIPNLPQASVPNGKSERENEEKKVWDGGEKPIGHRPAQFAFPALPHWEIGERLGRSEEHTS